ncbi:MAG: hypothetical protein AB1762_17535 [Gemmatimonadota bacterium]
MSEDSVRVYVNGRGVDAVAGARAVDAVRVFDAVVAAEVEGGRRALTDSRGLPLDPATPVFSGLILRVVSSRAARGEAGA